MAKPFDGNSSEHIRKTEISVIPEIDRFRAFLFPNNIRKYRKERQIDSLLQLSQQIPSTTYIRLSKIERGEIFARPKEMRLIAAALGVEVDKLLVDIDDPAFDIAAWAEDYKSPNGMDEEADTMAVLLAAAVRNRRARDEALTIATLERDYGLAPVILSRIENAYKTLDRWSPTIQNSLFQLFEVDDADALAQYLKAAHDRGDLDTFLPHIANPEERAAKTRAKLRSLRAELVAPAPERRPERKAAAARVSGLAATPFHAVPTAVRRTVPIYGSPLHDGLIARVNTGDQIEVTGQAGPRSYGLRVCRPSLGPGLPGRSIVIVDPDRFPAAGNLAVLRQKDGLRLLAVTEDRQGRMIGFSTNPDMEIALDDLPPQDVATVLSAQFI